MYVRTYMCVCLFLREGSSSSKSINKTHSAIFGLFRNRIVTGKRQVRDLTRNFVTVLHRLEHNTRERKKKVILPRVVFFLLLLFLKLVLLTKVKILQANF